MHHLDVGGGGGNGGGGSYHGPGRRKRDKNSPRRNKGGRRRGGGNAAAASAAAGESSSDPPSHEGSVGTITPPAEFELMSLEDRAYWLGAVCGVMSVTSRRLCSRSTRCPVHSDAQRREVRIKWLGGGGGGQQQQQQQHQDATAAAAEDAHVDIDR